MSGGSSVGGVLNYNVDVNNSQSRSVQTDKTYLDSVSSTSKQKITESVCAGFTQETNIDSRLTGISVDDKVIMTNAEDNKSLSNHKALVHSAYTTGSENVESTQETCTSLVTKPRHGRGMIPMVSMGTHGNESCGNDTSPFGNVKTEVCRSKVKWKLFSNLNKNDYYVHINHEFLHNLKGVPDIDYSLNTKLTMSKGQQPSFANCHNKQCVVLKDCTDDCSANQNYKNKSNSVIELPKIICEQEQMIQKRFSLGPNHFGLMHGDRDSAYVDDDDIDVDEDDVTESQFNVNSELLSRTPRCNLPISQLLYLGETKANVSDNPQETSTLLTSGKDPYNLERYALKYSPDHQNDSRSDGFDKERGIIAKT